MKMSALVDYIDSIVDEERSAKIRRTKKMKRIEQHIAVAILNNNPKRAIDLAEMYDIPPQEFGKMVAKYSAFAIGSAAAKD